MRLFNLKRSAYWPRGNIWKTIGLTLISLILDAYYVWVGAFKPQMITSILFWLFGVFILIVCWTIFFAIPNLWDDWKKIQRDAISFLLILDDIMKGSGRESVYLQSIGAMMGGKAPDELKKIAHYLKKWRYIKIGEIMGTTESPLWHEWEITPKQRGRRQIEKELSKKNQPAKY